MPPRKPRTPRRDRAADELSRAREAELGRAGGLHATRHPAPPAEGRWSRVLGRVRELVGPRRRRGGPS